MLFSRSPEMGGFDSDFGEELKSAQEKGTRTAPMPDIQARLLVRGQERKSRRSDVLMTVEG
jgi:hypothetical protein